MPIKKILEMCTVFIILALISFVYTNLSFIDPKLNMIANVIYSSIVIFVILFTVLKYENRGLDSLGIYTSNIKKQLLIGLFIFINIISPILFKLFWEGHDNTILLIKHMTPPIFIFNLLDNFLFVGISEEIIFRGYLLTRLKEISNSSIFAIIVSSIIFGACHYPINKDIGQVVLAILIGILFSSYKVVYKNCGLLSLAFADGLYDASLLALGYLLL